MYLLVSGSFPLPERKHARRRTSNWYNYNRRSTRHEQFYIFVLNLSHTNPRRPSAAPCSTCQTINLQHSFQIEMSERLQEPDYWRNYRLTGAPVQLSPIKMSRNVAEAYETLKSQYRFLPRIVIGLLEYPRIKRSWSLQLFQRQANLFFRNENYLLCLVFREI